MNKHFAMMEMNMAMMMDMCMCKSDNSIGYEFDR